MFPAGGLPSNMPQHDAAHDQGRRVAPSMRRQIGRARLAEKDGRVGYGEFLIEVVTWLHG